MKKVRVRMGPAGTPLIQRSPSDVDVTIKLADLEASEEFDLLSSACSRLGSSNGRRHTKCARGLSRNKR